MNYNQFFKEELNKLKAEGNYRVFADLEKIAGNFPQALNYKEDNVSEVTVWCSNDYLGMSQKNVVIESGCVNQQLKSYRHRLLVRLSFSVWRLPKISLLQS